MSWSFGGRGVPPQVKRLRRRLRSARRWTVIAGLWGGVAAVLIPLGGVSAWDAIWAGLFGASAALATVRWIDYRATARALPAETDQLALSGASALVAEAQGLAGTVAGRIRRGREAAQYRRSAAAPAFGRLERAQRAFAELAPRLTGPAADTLADARDAQATLRDLAERIRGVEGSLAVVPAEQRSSIEESRGILVERLETGVAAFEEMVGAAGQVIAEQSALDGVVASGSDPTVSRLREATAKLHGFAQGIGEMRQFHTDPDSLAGSFVAIRYSPRGGRPSRRLSVCTGRRERA